MKPKHAKLIARIVAFDMLKGMAHAHALGMMHLDVKPANFMISASGVVKLGDFGLSEEGRERRGEGLVPDAVFAAPETQASSVPYTAAKDKEIGTKTKELCVDFLAPALRRLLKAGPLEENVRSGIDGYEEGQSFGTTQRHLPRGHTPSQSGASRQEASARKEDRSRARWVRRSPCSVIVLHVAPSRHVLAECPSEARTRPLPIYLSRRLQAAS